MNTNTIISLPVAADLSAYSHVGVKLTSTGINLAGAGERVIGTLIRGNNKADGLSTAVGMAADVFLTAGNGVHFVTCGNNAAIALGDEIEEWSSGRYVKRGGTISGTAEADDDLITATNHGFVAGDKVMFPSLTGGAGLTAGVTYYVISTGLTANAFSVSATSGGAAVNISTDYSALTVRPSKGADAAGLALEAIPANSVGGIFRAILFGRPSVAGADVLTAAITLTAADSGKTFYLSLAAGFAVTLPAPTPGFKARFFVKTAPSGGSYTIVTPGSPDQILGGRVVVSADAAGDTENAATGTTITFVDGQAVFGDAVDVESDGSAYYALGVAAVAAGLTITG